jgi:hypothetical protein
VRIPLDIALYAPDDGRITGLYAVIKVGKGPAICKVRGRNDCSAPVSDVHFRVYAGYVIDLGERYATGKQYQGVDVRATEYLIANVHVRNDLEPETGQ